MFDSGLQIKYMHLAAKHGIGLHYWYTNALSSYGTIIPIISPGLIFVQQAFLMGLFSGELNFEGVC